MADGLLARRPAVGERARPWPLSRAIVTGVLAGAAFGFVFGLEAGALSVPVVALVLWRGIGARGLTLAAGVLLGVVVPVLYLAEPGDPRGGNHFAYAVQHITAHWVGVAALGLLLGALWRSLRPVASRPAEPLAPPVAGDLRPLVGVDDQHG